MLLRDYTDYMTTVKGVVLGHMTKESQAHSCAQWDRDVSWNISCSSEPHLSPVPCWVIITSLLQHNRLIGLCHLPLWCYSWNQSATPSLGGWSVLYQQLFCLWVIEEWLIITQIYLLDMSTQNLFYLLAENFRKLNWMFHIIKKGFGVQKYFLVAQWLGESIAAQHLWWHHWCFNPCLFHSAMVSQFMRNLNMPTI